MRTLLQMAEALRVGDLAMWPWFALNDAEIDELAALYAELP